MYSLMMLRTISFMFLILTCVTQSSRVNRLEKRLNVMEQKIFQDTFAFREDIEMIREKLNDSVNCTSEASHEQDVDYDSIIKINEIKRKIDLLLRTVKKTMTEEKQYIRSVLKEMWSEIEGIQNVATDTENRLLEKLEVHANNFELLRSDHALQGSQLGKANEELEKKVTAVSLDNYQRLNLKIDEQVISLKRDLHLEREKFSSIVKSLEQKLEIVSMRQCSDVPWTIKYETSCYFIGNDKSTWTQAKSKCESYGGMLAEVENEAENTFLIRFATQKGVGGVGAWIGATDKDTEGAWIWGSSKTQLGWSNFKGNEPNGGSIENCLHLNKLAYWAWNDVRCHTHMGYICERKNL